MNFHCSLQTIKQWFCNLVKTLLRRFRWGFLLAGFIALAMAGLSWTLETSANYWFWHRYYNTTTLSTIILFFCLLRPHVLLFWNGCSFWHVTIYTSSFFFLCSKANIVDAEDSSSPSSGNYALTRQDSFPRGD